MKKQLHFGRKISTLIFLLLGTGAMGCASAYLKKVGEDPSPAYRRIFVTEYNLAWEATIDTFKSSPMEVVNRESGSLQTKWIDNTAERNLLDSVGADLPYVKAQYRFRVTLARGRVDDLDTVRVTVQKEQQIQRDVLEGWRNRMSDGVQENSLLYRIGKLIDMKTRLNEIEEQKLREELNRN